MRVNAVTACSGFSLTLYNTAVCSCGIVHLSSYTFITNITSVSFISPCILTMNSISSSVFLINKFLKEVIFG